jgi:hypothetical protein
MPSTRAYGGLQALDWDTQVTHAVKTITENIGPRGLHASSSILDSTLPSSKLAFHHWRQIQYTGQDLARDERFSSQHDKAAAKAGRGRGERGGRGEGRKGRVRLANSEFRKRQLSQLEEVEFVVPSVPDVKTCACPALESSLQLPSPVS